MHFCGQTRLQSPQLTHLLGSIRAIPLFRLIASKRHTFSHAPQLIQDAPHTLNRSLSVSFELQAIRTVWLLGKSFMSFCGQTSLHMPQPLHLLRSIIAKPLQISIAFSGQAFAQSPCPMHPYLQFLGPSKNCFADLHDAYPWYSDSFGETLEIPAHSTTARLIAVSSLEVSTFGFFFTKRPRIASTIPTKIPRPIVRTRGTVRLKFIFIAASYIPNRPTDRPVKPINDKLTIAAANRVIGAP